MAVATVKRSAPPGSTSDDAAILDLDPSRGNDAAELGVPAEEVSAESVVGDGVKTVGEASVKDSYEAASEVGGDIGPKEGVEEKIPDPDISSRSVKWAHVRWKTSELKLHPEFKDLLWITENYLHERANLDQLESAIRTFKDSPAYQSPIHKKFYEKALDKVGKGFVKHVKDSEESFTRDPFETTAQAKAAYETILGVKLQTQLPVEYVRFLDVDWRKQELDNHPEFSKLLIATQQFLDGQQDEEVLREQLQVFSKSEDYKNQNNNKFYTAAFSKLARGVARNRFKFMQAKGAYGFEAGPHTRASKIKKLYEEVLQRNLRAKVGAKKTTLPARDWKWTGRVGLSHTYLFRPFLSKGLGLSDDLIASTSIIGVDGVAKMPVSDTTSLTLGGSFDYNSSYAVPEVPEGGNPGEGSIFPDGSTGGTYESEGLGAGRTLNYDARIGLERAVESGSAEVYGGISVGRLAQDSALNNHGRVVFGKVGTRAYHAFDLGLQDKWRVGFWGPLASTEVLFPLTKGQALFNDDPASGTTLDLWNKIPLQLGAFIEYGPNGFQQPNLGNLSTLEGMHVLAQGAVNTVFIDQLAKSAADAGETAAAFATQPDDETNRSAVRPISYLYTIQSIRAGFSSGIDGKRVVSQLVNHGNVFHKVMLAGAEIGAMSYGLALRSSDDLGRAARGNIMFHSRLATAYSGAVHTFALRRTPETKKEKIVTGLVASATGLAGLGLALFPPTGCAKGTSKEFLPFNAGAFLALFEIEDSATFQQQARCVVMRNGAASVHAGALMSIGFAPLFNLMSSSANKSRAPQSDKSPRTQMSFSGSVVPVPGRFSTNLGMSLRW